MKKIVLAVFVTVYPGTMFGSCYILTSYFKHSSIAMMWGFTITDFVIATILLIILYFKMDKQIDVAIQRFVPPKKKLENVTNVDI